METLEELKKQYLEATRIYMENLERYSSLLADKEKYYFAPLELIAELNRAEREMTDAQYKKHEIHSKIWQLNNPD